MPSYEIGSFEKGKIHFVRPVFSSAAICDWLEYKTKKWNDGWILPSEMRKKSSCKNYLIEIGPVMQLFTNVQIHF